MYHLQLYVHIPVLHTQGLTACFFLTENRILNMSSGTSAGSKPAMFWEQIKFDAPNKAFAPLSGQERMSSQRRQEGACNCVEHHVGQVDHPMSKYGEYVQYYVIPLAK